MKCENWDNKNYDCKTCGELVKPLSSHAVLADVRELIRLIDDREIKIYMCRGTDIIIEAVDLIERLRAHIV